MARLTRSTRSLLDDFFENDELKTHLATVALAEFGLGGDETGSALALAALSEPAAWRVKTKARGPSLVAVLEEVAKAAGVEAFDSPIREVSAAEDKMRALTLEDGEALKARKLMAASEAAAARAGLPVAHALAPLARRQGAVADVRVKFAKAPPSPIGDKDAIFYVAESVEILSEARDAALEGRLPDRPPISFEFMRDEIVVRAPYCPAVLRTEGEEREWTEQDRQALGRLIVARLAPFLNGATQTVRRVDVKVTQAGARQSEPQAGAVIAPPPGHDAIGAAAKLALELIRGE
jgi:phytoene dehydrogenase-like protein